MPRVRYTLMTAAVAALLLLLPARCSFRLDAVISGDVYETLARDRASLSGHHVSGLLAIAKARA